MTTDPILTPKEVIDVGTDNGDFDEEAVDYSPPVDQLLALGDIRGQEEWLDYPRLGLTDKDIPELIRLATDQELHWGEAENKVVWAAIHAWRALGQLRAEAAVQPLLDLIEPHIEIGDDWVFEEMPDVFGMIGPSTLPVLEAYIAKKHKVEGAASCVAEGIEQIAKRFPEARDLCVAAIIRRLERFQTNDEFLNAILIDGLTELRATEALTLIERAFKADKVDEFVRGDWEDIQIEFGLKEKRDTPARPFEMVHDPTYALLDELETIEELEGFEEEMEDDPVSPSDLFGPSAVITPKAAAKKAAKRKQASKSRKMNRKR